MYTFAFASGAPCSVVTLPVIRAPLCPSAVPATDASRSATNAAARRTPATLFMVGPRSGVPRAQTADASGIGTDTAPQRGCGRRLRPFAPGATFPPPQVSSRQRRGHAPESSEVNPAERNPRTARKRYGVSAREALTD